MAAKSDKVIITCAVTGAIHTPTMSDALADHARPDRRAGHRRGRGRRRHPAPACAQSAGRPPDRRSRGVHAVPAAHQAGDRRGHQHHHRRHRQHDGRGAARRRDEVLAGNVLAQHGLDELRALSAWPPATRPGSTTGRSRICSAPTRPSSATPSRDIEQISKLLGEGHGTKFEHECYDVGHLYNLAHCVDKAGSSRRSSCS